MKVLTIFEERHNKDLISFFLEGRLGVNVHSVSSVHDALFLVDMENQEFDLIFCVFSFDIQCLLAHIISKNFKSKLICFTHEIPVDPYLDSLSDRIQFVSRSAWFEELQKPGKADIFQEENVSPGQSEFCRISPSLIILAHPLPDPIYAQSSDKIFNPIAHKGSELDRNDLENFRDKLDIQTLYVKRHYYREFVLNIQRNYALTADTSSEGQKFDTGALSLMPEILKNVLDEKLERLEVLRKRALEIEKKKAELISGAVYPPVTVQHERMIHHETVISTAPVEQGVSTIQEEDQKHHPVIEAVEKAKQAEDRRGQILASVVSELVANLDAIREVGRRLGFGKEVQELTKKNVASTILRIKEAPKLSSLLLRLKQDDSNYISSHSLFLAYVSSALASQMEWKSETTCHKLTLASFLHDITLTNHELAAIQTLPELRKKQSQFTMEEMKDYNNHPIIAAEVARKFDEVPPDVDTIIIQHHERPDGSGFPRGHSHLRIAPLSIVFIVAHDFVHYLLRERNDLNEIDETVIQKFVNQYPRNQILGNFKRVLNGILRLST